MADVTLSLSGNSASVVTSSGYSVPGWSNGYVGNAGTVFGITIDHNITLSINGVVASGLVGVVDAVPSYELSGVSGVVSAGSVTTSQEVSITLTGVGDICSVGSILTTQDITISMSGVQATLYTGTETASSAISVDMTGVAGSGYVGIVDTLKSYDLTSSSILCQVGNILAQQEISIALTGVVTFGFVNSVYGPGNVTVSMSGVSAVCEIGNTAEPFNTYTVPTELELRNKSMSDAMGVVILLNKKSKVVI